MPEKQNRRTFLTTAASVASVLFFIPCGVFAQDILKERAGKKPFSFEVGANRTVVLKEGDAPLWRYNANFLKHPRVPDKDRRSMAGCYVHPLYGIDGEILTDDAPRDHYHHHGVFWTWPHVEMHRENGTTEKYDTWTSNTRLKQLFVRFHDLDVGADRAVFRVENGWFLAPEVNRYDRDEQGRPAAEKIVDEFVTITSHRMETDDGVRSRCIDFKFDWVVGEFPITLRGAEGKSYGGFSVRFRPSTSKPGGDSIITVPEGVAKEDLPEKPLPWADYTSLFHRDEHDRPFGDASGAAIFVSPNHPDYPPTWLTRYYGPLCVGWPGVHGKTFQPGERLTLEYRVWIHDQQVDVDTIRSMYEQYGEEIGK